MKTKNFLMLALSLCLVAIIAVGGTLAYFTTTTKPKENVFTAGQVAIDLVDEAYVPAGHDDEGWAIDPDGTQDGGEHYTNVQPGNTIGKRVGVTLGEDSLDCYVAVKVEFGTTVAAGLDMSTMIDSLLTSTATKGWVNNYDAATDGNTVIFYSQTPLTQDQTSVELFDQIVVPTSWGNEIVDNDFSIKVSAAAVQKLTLDPPAMEHSEEDPDVYEMNDAMRELHKLLTETTTTTP